MSRSPVVPKLARINAAVFILMRTVTFPLVVEEFSGIRGAVGKPAGTSSVAADVVCPQTFKFNIVTHDAAVITAGHFWKATKVIIRASSFPFAVTKLAGIIRAVGIPALSYAITAHVVFPLAFKDAAIIIKTHAMSCHLATSVYRTEVWAFPERSKRNKWWWKMMEYAQQKLFWVQNCTLKWREVCKSTATWKWGFMLLYIPRTRWVMRWVPGARAHAAAARWRKPKTVTVIGASTGVVVAAVAAAVAFITIVVGVTFATAATRVPKWVLDGVNSVFHAAGQTVNDMM
jgi:hypothetical protein